MTEALVTAAAYTGGVRVATPDLAACAEWARKPDHFVWIGLHEADDAVLRTLQGLFGLHALAVEDSLHAHQRPKLEVYGGSVFIVLPTARRIEGRLCFGETNIFVGRGFVITVRHGPSQSYADVRSRCESMPEMLGHGEDFVLHAIMDFVVDTYFPILDEFEDEVGSIEDKVIAGLFKPLDIEAIYRLRRDLHRFRRAVAPLLDVCSRLERFELPMIDPEMHPYFRDVHDHLIRAINEIDTLRETLTFAFDAHLMLTSSQQTMVTRKLASWAAILAVPTAIAGIYGMNFEFMPELRWQYGYFVVLGAIAGLCTGLLFWFRRLRWL